MVVVVFQRVQSFGFVSRNPVLRNITEYLVDEGSYEEEALLGTLPVDCTFPLTACINCFSCSGVVCLLLDATVQTTSILCFLGQKLDDDKQDAIPEAFIDQDDVLLKVCKFG